MKIIIIEGPDNTGKNTLINDILENNEIVKVIHCGKPKSENPFYEQCKLFGKLTNIATLDITSDVTVFNRFHYGEYVYGQLYRNGNPYSIKQMIELIDNELSKYDVYYVQLISTSAKLLKNNDDNKSLSKAKITNIKKELKLFNDVYELSILNKHKIIINDGDKFRNKEDILTEFNNFINNK